MGTTVIVAAQQKNTGVLNQPEEEVLAVAGSVAE
jgi:hypothetical protein